MQLLPTPEQIRGTRNEWGHVHECVVGDACHPTWLDTSGPGLTWQEPVPDPAATVAVTTRVVHDGYLVAVPGDVITPEQATLWGVTP